MSAGLGKLLTFSSTFAPGNSDPTLLGLITSVPGSGVAVEGIGVPVAAGVRVGVLVGSGVLVAVALAVAVRVGVRVAVAIRVGVRVTVAIAVAVRVRVGSGVKVGVETESASTNLKSSNT